MLKKKDLNIGTLALPPRIKETLQKKKSLMALDDVCSSQQIAVLAGEDCLLGSGSRIILTSREISKYLNLDVPKYTRLRN